jgi:tRNA A-37 threonylcarbamoyl transferase component Bud32
MTRKAKRTKKKKGARANDTLDRLLFPAKRKSKKVSSRSKAASRSKSESKSKAAPKAKTPSKAKARIKKSPARSARKPKKAKTKKTPVRSGRSTKKAAGKKSAVRTAKAKKNTASRKKPSAKKTTHSKPVVKKAAPSKKHAAKKSSVRAKPKVKHKAKSRAAPKVKVKVKKFSARAARISKKAAKKKLPARSARTPKKAAKKKLPARSARLPKKAVPKKSAVRSARKVKKASSRAKPAAKKIARRRPALKKAAVPKKPAAPRKPVRKKKTLDDYKIVSMIGQGGMGKIYKAIDKHSKKIIIMKQLLIAEREILRKRFKREADIMLSLNHKNIVSVYDYLKKGSSYFIIMEFVDGMSLEDLIRKRGKIEPVRALLIFNELCRGLKYAHDRQIIHRDIKPNNVLISKTGAVKLVDFGIAKSLREDDEALTKTGVVMGTPAYMSPEQLVSTKYVDNLTDIYSMGVIFYQMITGQKPYAAEFTAENFRKITLGEYTNPKQLNPDLPGYCMHIVKKAMHHKKEKRVKNLQELIQYMSKHLKQFKTQQQIHNEIKKALADR